jgi:hypothetical protein
MLALTLEYCIFENNNTAGRALVAGFEPGGDAGAVKWAKTDGAVIRNNWFHDNYGFGMWFDGYNRNAFVHDNVVEHDLTGLFYEISNGGTIIEHNYFAANGDGVSNNYPFNTQQMVISCSACDGTGVGGGPNVTSEVRYNDLDSTHVTGYDAPIVLLNHSVHPNPERTRNWYVHHNRMWARQTLASRCRIGLADSSSAPKAGDIGSSSANNRFDFNEYHVADINGIYWEHDTTGGNVPGPRTWAQFQASPAIAYSNGLRQEAHGTRVVI